VAEDLAEHDRILERAMQIGPDDTRRSDAVV
jgi:hypothetical protein